MSKVISKYPIRRYVIQEREYEYMRFDGTQEFGLWRIVASRHMGHHAIGEAEALSEEHTNREYRVIDTQAEEGKE